MTFHNNNNLLYRMNDLTINENKKKRNDLIQKDEFTRDLFDNNFDIYNEKEIDISIRIKLCGIENKYCKKYYDDEDFVYNKFKLTNDIEFNNILHFNTTSLYMKNLYLFDLTNNYYNNLQYLKPIERLNFMPKNLLLNTDEFIKIIRYLLINDLFEYNKCVYEKLNIDEEEFNELIYGLHLITRHLKIIINHCKIILHDEKNIKKFFKLLNNMCIILLHLFTIND